MRAFLFCAGIFFLVLLGGCSGGGSPGTTAVPAPSNLTITTGSDPNLITLRWTASSGAVDGYILEGRIDHGAFSPLNSLSRLIPIGAQEVQVSFAPDAPDSTDYGFRLCAARGSESSVYSNEAVFHRPLAVPTDLKAAFLDDQAGVNLSWTTNSVMADGSMVERSLADNLGKPLGDWKNIPVPAGLQTSFMDQSVQEFSTYVYRVSNRAGGTAGTPSTPSNPSTVLMFTPGSVRVEPCPGGLQISWVNRSPSTTQISLRRTPGPKGGGEIARLPAGTTTYQDLTIPSGYFYYSVVATNGSFFTSGKPIQGVTAPLPGALRLSSRAVPGPDSSDMALLPQGTWVELCSSPFGILSNGDPWPAIFPNDSLAQYPAALRVDALGWPHAFYEAADPVDPQQAKLTHLWYDGTHWQTDGVSTARPVVAPSKDRGITPALDPTGGIHVLLDLPTPDFPHGGYTRSLSYARKKEGPWSVESLATIGPLVELEGPCELRLDRTGQPHVLAGNSAFFCEYTRVAPGANWTSELVWKDATIGGNWCFQSGNWWDPSTACVVFDRMTPGDPVGEYSLLAIMKKFGVWGAPTVIGHHYNDGYGTRASLARSPDGSRLAVAHATSSGLKLYVHDGKFWGETLVAGPTLVVPKMGFDAQNKIHILVRDYLNSRFQEWCE